jgi:hypothetical protein
LVTEPLHIFARNKPKNEKMKKLFLSLALASAVAFATNAQDMTSKKGVPILPEAGDWSIGFDATSLIQYFGNLANGSTNNNSSLSPQENFTLVGLYVKDESTSYRAKLRIGFGSTTQDNLVYQDVTTPATPPATVTDEKKTSAMNITIGGGIQKNRGKGRLRGIYGAELGIMLGSGKTEYTYGNPFSATFTTPNSTMDWVNLPNNGVATGSRTTVQKNGSTFGIQLNGFIGAEFFFAPKMSISAEYGWGLMMNSTGEGETSTETINTTGNGGLVTTAKSGKSSAFSIDVMNAGSIVFHCYF